MRGAKYEIGDTGDAFEIYRNGKAVAVVNYSLGHNGAIAVRTALNNLEAGRTVRAKRPVQHTQPAIALLERWHRAHENGAGTVSVAEDTSDFLAQQQAGA